MEKIIRSISEIDAADRQALEHLIGAPLTEHQQIVIHVVGEPTTAIETPAAEAGEIPSWWNIYEGLSEGDVDRLDRAIRERANLTRDFE